MYVRLAFAVAAHLDPEILVVDEVLAVGDMAFQKKCLGKMGDFGRTGRTVLFVSHNMAAVENLCQRGIILRNGEVAFDGDAKTAVQQYVQGVSNWLEREEISAIDLKSAVRPSDVEGGALERLELYTADGQPFNGFLPIGGGLRFNLQFRLKKATEDFDPRINIKDLYGRIIFSLRGSFEAERPWGVRSGHQEFVCEVPELPLLPGEYRIEAGLAIENQWVDYVEDALRITIIESDYYGTGVVPKSGFCVLEHHWRVASEIAVSGAGPGGQEPVAKNSAGPKKPSDLQSRITE
jgi:lipopolysaccharide transport system ATP-binding protein